MVETKDVAVGRKTRKSFAKITEVMEMPNLIEVQKESYSQFLKTGIAQAIADMGKISDYNNEFELYFDKSRLGDTPKYDIKECKKREATYAVPLYFHAVLYNKNTDEYKESEIYIGEFPKMTDAGTFIINGAERVVISQLVRSPGVYFGMTHDKTGKKLFSTTVIPNRGAWLEFETDQNDMFYVKIDKNKKIPITTFVRALSFITGLETNDEIAEFFGNDQKILATLEKDSTSNGTEALLAVYKNVRPGEPPTVDVAENLIRNLFFDTRRYDLSKVGRYKYNKKLSITDRLRGQLLARDVISEDGELLASAGTRADAALCRQIEQAGVKTVYADVEGIEVKIISNQMCDASEFLPEFTAEELEAIGVNDKVAYSVLQKVLEESEGMDKQDKIAVIKAHLDNLIPNHITIDDIFAAVNYLCCTDYFVGRFDDIDHLGNRRIRCVGELLQNQLNIGLSNLSKAVREKFSLHTFEPDKLTPANLVNTRVIISKVREFFGSSPLSQFMDQTNPLAELTHKRRLSALGPGGLSRDRAGFEVRDVHYSHYGRMCPIESPEGGNIGLISYLATFARINKYGFVEAPFRRVDKETGKVLDEVVYMTADVEDEYLVAQANEDLDENNCFVNERVTCRCRSDFRDVDRKSVDFMDVSPRMVFSVATGMIPFLEHDDANRALMGANMQRQAVPLLRTEAPFVGTGMEYKAACDSGVCVLAEHAGTVTSVSAKKIVIRTDDGEDDVYELMKFMRSNASTCTNQKPIVNKGDRVEANEVIADGPATSEGEVALGKNALIGFMTWEGYNYEDAVLLNERMVREDVYTSIHIDKYEVEARETKLGPESITKDIPNVGDAALSKLDDKGVIYIGAEVKDNDILVGKVTPKAEAESTPEERLLRAIFGEKAKEYKDTSLRLPHGSYGIVIDVDTYTRENSEELGPGVNKIVRVYVAQKRKISVGDKMAGRHGNKGVVSRILPQEDMPFLEDGTPLDIVLNPLGVPSRMNVGQVLEVTLGRACRELGWKIMTPIFDGAQESDIIECLKEADAHALANGNARIPEDGKVWLYDGRTGERFDNRITVGVMYFLKLHHLVDDKIHARSTGPYSLVTQQPLGGKAQFGGQRFGEMEVWALEAYGAAYTLQEILTVKSDDVIGRRAAFSAIVEGDNVPKPGIPESFKVLVKELQALGLDITAFDDNDVMIDLTQDYDDDGAPTFTEEDLAKAQMDDEARDRGEDIDDEDEDEADEANVDHELDILMGAGDTIVDSTSEMPSFEESEDFSLDD